MDSLVVNAAVSARGDYKEAMSTFSPAGSSAGVARREVADLRPWTELRSRVREFTAVAFIAALSAHVPDTALAVTHAETAALAIPYQGLLELQDEREAAETEMLSYMDLDEGWDGIGSQAPKPDAISDALSFISLLALGIKTPEPTVSADGAVGWFWKEEGIFVSVEFQGSERLVYFGKSSAHQKVARGVVRFDGTTVPQDLLDVLESI